MQQRAWSAQLIRQNRERMASAFAATLAELNAGPGPEKIGYDRSTGEEVVAARPFFRPEDFRLVWGYHVDTESETLYETDRFGDPVTVRRNSSIYTNLIIGYSENLNGLVVIKTNVDVSGTGGAAVFMRDDVSRAVHNWFTDEYMVFDRAERWIDRLAALLSPDRRFRFFVPAETDLSIHTADGEPILTYMEQHEGAADFRKFFRRFAG